MKKHIGGVPAVPGILVITFLMSALLGACASIPHDPNYDGASGGAPAEVEPRRCIDFCWVMSVNNYNYFEARVFVNGRRVATLPGMMAKEVGIPITRTMLDGSGCMVVFVKLWADTNTAHSSKACPVAGSRLELAIEESNGGYPPHLWLQDWRTR